MAIGVVGRKAGMTRVFTEQGESIPVTVIEVEPNRVTQLKSDETDGYLAIQVTTGSSKSSHVNKPASGHFVKAGVEAGRSVWEFRAEQSDLEGIEVGSEIKADRFEAGQIVDVRGRSQGKGYQGGVKRHNFRTQDATHGNSLSHRAPGSIGQCQTPGRVFKGKKMAGQMGAVQRCQQNLEVVRVDAERNLLLVKGSVPGSRGGDLIVTPAVKMKNKG
ncbi:MAG: 50S ribosomal protein L3 [Candidatus Thiodiazotropha sp. (ex Clathrolucina costata)]|nr:50S ribosomal protein L3 [Candidatus Thiodiazotropha taylori]